MYSIGEMARRTGVKVPTIRYYESVGLLDDPGRTEGNQRRYGDAELERLAFIRHGRDLGLSLEDIRDLIGLNADPDMPCADAHAIAEKHLAAVEARIARLQTLRDELRRITSKHDAGTIGACYVIRSLADHDLCESEHA